MYMRTEWPCTEKVRYKRSWPVLGQIRFASTSISHLYPAIVNIYVKVIIHLLEVF